MKVFLFGKDTIEVLRMELTQIIYISSIDFKSHKPNMGDVRDQGCVYLHRTCINL